MRLQNFTALVTGAASGLGLATSVELANHGIKVIGVDLAGAIEDAPKHENISYRSADVTSEEEVLSALEFDYTDPLRLAVNCAGIAPASKILTKDGPHDLNLFRKTIEVNLIGTFNVMRLAAQKIAEADPLEHGQRGVIVNTASVAAYEGQIGQAAYSASKGGVVGLTIQAARDLAREGIRVNTIAPGIMDTPMLASFPDSVREALAESVNFPKRLGTPAEYAKLVRMIVEHDYLNGETIRMDGAIRMQAR